MFPCSDRLEHVHYDIRGPLYQAALRMEAQGVEVLKLNAGNPARFGFPLPDSLRQALWAQLDEAVPYADVRGMTEARELLCAYHTKAGLPEVTPEDIFICNGVSEAASMLMTALVCAGDEILVPAPCYSLWSINAWLNGGRPIFYRCDPADGWNPDVADIRAKLSPRTKAILVINPNNPTGAVYSRRVLTEIAEIARQHHLMLLADEIYDRLILDDSPYDSMGAIAPDLACVTFNGLSKSHVVCGFRCGWMVFSGPRAERAAVQEGVMNLASMRICGNALTQLVIPAALRDQESTRQMLRPGGRLFEQRAAVMRVLDRIDGVSYVPNSAAFYLFPGLEPGRFDFADAPDFAIRLLEEEHILVVPGTGFDWQEDLRFRIVMLPEPQRLEQAMEALSAFLERHRR